MPSSEPSRPALALHDLDTPSRCFVLAVCLEDEDFEREGLAREPACTHVSRSVWMRGALAREGAEPGEVSGKLSALLDVRYLDAIWFVRAQTPAKLQQGLRAYLRRGERAGLPGLLWAFATDRRDCVRSLADVLAQETFLKLCGELRGAEVETRTERPA